MYTKPVVTVEANDGQPCGVQVRRMCSRRRMRSRMRRVKGTRKRRRKGRGRQLVVDREGARDLLYIGITIL